jgi:hypothetical protein
MPSKYSERSYCGIYCHVTGVAWLNKTWFLDWLLDLLAYITSHNKLQSLGTVSSTALVVHLDQFLQERLLSSGSSLNTSGRTGLTILPRPAKQLGWLGSWTPARTAFSELELDLSLNCPLALELILTVLLNSFLPFCCCSYCSPLLNCLVGSGVWSTVSSHGPQRDYRLSFSLKRLSSRYHGNANP